MKALRIVLLILGVLFVASFVTGVQRVGGDTVTYYSGWHRLLPLAAALFCFGWFVGLRKRLTWAWYIGCGILILLIVQVFLFQALLPFLSAPTTLFGWWMLISQTIFAVLIFLALKKWWIPKKHEFHGTPIA